MQDFNKSLIIYIKRQTGECKLQSYMLGVKPEGLCFGFRGTLVVLEFV